MTFKELERIRLQLKAMVRRIAASNLQNRQLIAFDLARVLDSIDPDFLRLARESENVPSATADDMAVKAPGSPQVPSDGAGAHLEPDQAPAMRRRP